MQTRWCRGVLAVLLSALGCAGLGGAGGLPEQLVESAYVEARSARAACRKDDADCCARQAAAAQQAMASGQSAGAAHAWQEVALSCPARKEQVRAPTRSIPASVPPGTDPGNAVVNVSYRVRLPPAVRLYWVAASVGARLLPVAAVAAPQPVDVEVHAIRFTGGRPGPLLVVERRLEIAFQPGAIVTIQIAEAPPGSPVPLAVSAEVQPPPRAAPSPPATPPRPGPAPRLESARVVAMQPHRTPLELAGYVEADAIPPHRVCLDAQGDLDTIRFLEAPHPRVAASLIDQFRDARHEPYRVNDLAVPSCMLVRWSVDE
jgi:hypothetical protein